MSDMPISAYAKRLGVRRATQAERDNAPVGHTPGQQGIPALSEHQWQRQVLQVAAVLNWVAYHPWLSIHSVSGFPDLVLVRERVIFAELKTEIGKLTRAQEQWRDLLLGAGAEWYCWKPSDAQAAADILGREG